MNDLTNILVSLHSLSTVAVLALFIGSGTALLRSLIEKYQEYRGQKSYIPNILLVVITALVGIVGSILAIVSNGGFTSANIAGQTKTFLDAFLIANGGYTVLKNTVFDYLSILFTKVFPGKHTDTIIKS